MSARKADAVVVGCDLCAKVGPVALTQEQAEALASYQGITPWPREGRHVCSGCREEIVDGKEKAKK